MEVEEKVEVQIESSTQQQEEGIVEIIQENKSSSEGEKENDMVIVDLLGSAEEEIQQPQEILQQQPQQQTTSRKRAAEVLSSAHPPGQIKGPPIPPGVFDVPLDLPPSPPRPTTTLVDLNEEANRVPQGGRVYVCPICGDNALASLRERDRHLLSEHSGELVFPCQVG